jgi:hypothetical protein
MVLKKVLKKILRPIAEAVTEGCKKNTDQIKKRLEMRYRE